MHVVQVESVTRDYTIGEVTTQALRGGHHRRGGHSAGTGLRSSGRRGRHALLPQHHRGQRRARGAAPAAAPHE